MPNEKNSKDANVARLAKGDDLSLGAAERKSASAVLSTPALSKGIAPDSNLVLSTMRSGANANHVGKVRGGGSDPFSVLLPKLGDVSRLSSLKAKLAEHLSNAQSMASNLEGDARRAKLCEESMLNQVFQWLFISDKGGD